jgi:predicted lipoprotein
LSWKRASTLRTDALVASRALMRASYWPVRTDVVERTLTETAPIDPRFVEELGADIKGLYALEYLLFGDGRSPDRARDRLLGPSGDRAARLATALAQDVSARAQQLVTRVADGRELAERLAGAKNEGLGMLVTQMVETIERVYAVPLLLAIQLQEVGRLQPSEIEGSPGGVSTGLVLAQLEGTSRFYLGNDRVGSLVERSSPDLHHRIQSAFGVATRSVRALGGSVETAARQHRAQLQAACTKVRDLELALKADLVSALGLTITFTTIDAD